MPRPTKQAIIDVIVAEVTAKQFTGDMRDGDAPPITLQNFQLETVGGSELAGDVTEGQRLSDVMAKTA